MNKKSESIIASILKALNGVKYGEVVIKIQDSRIIQIERLEKFRVPNVETRSCYTSGSRSDTVKINDIWDAQGRS